MVKKVIPAILFAMILVFCTTNESTGFLTEEEARANIKEILQNINEPEIA